MTVTANIPVIDISADGANQDQVARELADAAAKHGFIYIKNTGKDVTINQIVTVFEMSRNLFNSPLEEKQRCKIQKNNRGWSGMGTETLDPGTQKMGDFKEAFNFGEFSKGKSLHPIPSTILSYENEIASFRDACHTLCRKILGLLGVGLGVTPPEFFASAHKEEDPSGTTLRFLYYPPPPPAASENVSADDVRAGAHSDYGSVTLLFRLKGQAGLEILKEDNTWAPVPVCPPGTENDPSPPVLVNIGDLLSYWTNGLLRSTVHRVVAGHEGKVVDGESDTDPRYSIAFFCHPSGDTALTAVPSEKVRNYAPNGAVSKGNPYAERKVLTADEHLQMRLQASYLQMYERKQAV